MALDQLGRDFLQRVGDGKGAEVGRDLREKDTLEDMIADLLAERSEIPSLDRLDDFIRFLQHELAQRLKRLLAIPRTPSRRSEDRHDVNQTSEPLRGGQRRHGELGSLVIW